MTEPHDRFSAENESVKPHEAPDWLWYGEVDGNIVVTFGRWPKNGAKWRYKWADVQPTEHDHPNADLPKRPFAFAVKRAPENGADEWRLFLDEGKAREAAEQLDGDYEGLYRVGDRRSAIDKRDATYKKAWDIYVETSMDSEKSSFDCIKAIVDAVALHPEPHGDIATVASLVRIWKDAPRKLGLPRPSLSALLQSIARELGGEPSIIPDVAQAVGVREALKKARDWVATAANGNKFAAATAMAQDDLELIDRALATTDAPPDWKQDQADTSVMPRKPVQHSSAANDDLAIIEEFVRRNVGGQPALDAIARLRAVPQTSGVWQPIETAPKDGSRFLATGGGLDDTIEVASYNERVGAWNTENYTLDDRDDDAEGYNRPSHWQPMPCPMTRPHGGGAA